MRTKTLYNGKPRVCESSNKVIPVRSRHRSNGSIDQSQFISSVCFITVRQTNKKEFSDGGAKGRTRTRNYTLYATKLPFPMHSPMKNQHRTSVVTTALMAASCRFTEGGSGNMSVNRTIQAALGNGIVGWWNTWSWRCTEQEYD